MLFGYLFKFRIRCKPSHVNQCNYELLVLFKAFACLVVIFWSPGTSLAERSRSSFALGVFYVLVRNCFISPVMSMRAVSGKSKPMRVGLRTGIHKLRVLMDGILFYGKENVLTIERNRFRKL
jgi:hypothetical protein